MNHSTNDHSQSSASSGRAPDSDTRKKTRISAPRPPKVDPASPSLPPPPPPSAHGAPSAPTRKTTRRSRRRGTSVSIDVDLGALVTRESLVDIKGTTKREALRQLCERAADIAGLPDAESISLAVLDVESRLNTHIGPNWATPHARLPDLSQPVILVIGRSAKGVVYAPDEPPINLIVLLLARADAAEMYLGVLARLVGALRDPARVARILRASGERAARAALTGRAAGKRVIVSRKLPGVTREMIRHMLRFARDIDVATVFIHIDAFEQPRLLTSVLDKHTVVVTSRHDLPAEEFARAGGVITLPFDVGNPAAAMRLAILLALGRGLVNRRQGVLALAGPRGSNTFDTMRLLHTRDVPLIEIDWAGQAALIAPGVLERVIELAEQVAHEGREGSAIGTTFLIGDEETLRPMLRQLIINPFRGYQENELNVLDVTLEETIKEFSALDGAFVLDRRGTLRSAGTYLSPPQGAEVELAGGLGTRHRAAAMMTAACSCVAVTVSASTGIVTVFYGGKTALTLGGDGHRRAGGGS